MRNNIEFVNITKRSTGQIGMFIHKGGEYDGKKDLIVGGEILAQRNFTNLIVDKASQLMACRLAPGQSVGSNLDTFLQDGLQYLSVGVGVLRDTNLPYNKDTNPVDTNQWNLQDPPNETLDVTQLRGEIFRKEFTSWSFVDIDGTDIATPSNTLKLVTTFYENEAEGPLTEMGLFGGNATSTKNSGYMFNYKTFPVNLIQAA